MKQYSNIFMDAFGKIYFLRLTIIFMLSIFFSAYAQQDSTITEVLSIKLLDGSEVVGHTEAEDDVSIHFITLTGVKMVIPKDQIKKISRISGNLVRGQFWKDDPNDTRLFFAPTARPLKTGEGYFSVYQIFFPYVAVGLTDFFSLAGGMSLLPGVDEQIFSLAPKLTPLQIDNFSLAAGVLYIAIPDGDNAGILYSVATHATEKAGITFGLGWPFSTGDLQDKPIVMIGGEVRASRSIKFVTENWFIPDTEVNFLSLGIRFFGESLAADFALILPTTDLDGFPFFPWLGFAYNFGTSK